MESLANPLEEAQPAHILCLTDSIGKLCESIDFAGREIDELRMEQSIALSSEQPEPSEQLTLSESMTSLVNDMPSGLLVLDRQNLVLLANRRAIELFGVSLVDRDFLDVIREIAVSVDASGQQIKLLSGRRLSITSTIRPEQNDQIVVVNDISEMADWLGLETVGQSSALMAHQLRTPLTAAMLYLDRLTSGIDGSDAGEASVQVGEKIALCLKQLEFTINRQLENVRWLQCPLTEGVFSFREVAETLRQTLEPLIEKKDASFRLDLGDNDCFIFGDSDALLAALTALAENAVSMQPGMQVTLSLHVTSTALEISIIDDGPGIPEEVLPRIFVPFVTTRQGGSGLGLTIAYQIAQRFDGELVAQNHKAGACFTFRLPLNRVRCTP